MEYQLQESNSKNTQLSNKLSHLSEQLTLVQKKYDKLKMTMDVQNKELEQSKEMTMVKSQSEESLQSLNSVCFFYFLVFKKFSWYYRTHRMYIIKS